MILAVATAALAPLTISTYRQPLLPPEPLPLGGYTERGDAVAEPGGDELFAEIALLRDGKQKIALVAFEGLTVPESLVREVQRRVPDTKIMLVATHTHSAPDTQMLNDRMTFRIPGIAPYKRRQLEWFALRVAGGISIAEQSKGRPIKSLTYHKSEVNLARARGIEELATNELFRIFADGEPLLTIFGAHPTIYGPDNRKTRGDWPGAFMRQVGGLVWPGAIGNASPNVEDGPPEQRIAQMVKGLSRTEPSTILDQSIQFYQEPIRFDRPVPHPDFARVNNVTPELAQIAVSRFAPAEASLTALRIGKLVIIGVPGEPSSSLEVRLQRHGIANGFDVAVVSHCNGWAGYLMSTATYNRGGYEATLMFYGPESSDRVYEAGQRLLRRMIKEKPPVPSHLVTNPGSVKTS